jgi:predicted nucleotidyltransferase
MAPTTQADPILRLQEKVGHEWPAIMRARTKAQQTRNELERILKGMSSADLSVVVFGSLARGEWTAKSDVDWTLLIDGQAVPQHLDVALEVAARLKRNKFGEPGQTGIFGNMTFSHDLVHKIGGREDTNENTTRRVLLLQESLPVGRPQAHERVLRLILSRYMNEDYGFKFGRAPFKVPRFLLNDFVRYWRTIAVDFVQKQRGQAGLGWGLRSAKLRMSRKLIFATGLLSCFSCELLCSGEVRDELMKRHSTLAMEGHFRAFIDRSPLEILASFLLELKIKSRTAIRLFSSYNAFLILLNDAGKRNHLKNLTPEKSGGDVVFDEVRQISREFQNGLTSLFFQDNALLRNLTITYGVF